LLPLVIYFLGAFAYTWAMHIPIVRNRLSVDEGKGRLLYWLGLPGPTLAALAVSSATGSLDELLGRLCVWPIPIQWWLLALLPVPVAYLLGTLIHAIRTGQRPARFFHRPRVGWLPLLMGQVGVVGSEEIGWRGFALPILMQHFGSLGGTLILGFIWATWHLPMFRVPSSHQKGSFWRFASSLTVWSVIMTATFTGSGGSILPAMLFHAMANLSHFVMDVPPEAEPYGEVILGLMAALSVFLLPHPLVTVIA
jgi:membrane protease YdiL (CAAX protease family)